MRFNKCIEVRAMLELGAEIKEGTGFVNYAGIVDDS